MGPELIGKMPNARMTVPEAARRVGVSPKTLLRWEDTGKSPKPKRRWHARRTYGEEGANRAVGCRGRLRCW